MSEAKRQPRAQRRPESGTLPKAVIMPEQKPTGARTALGARRIGKFARVLIVDDHDEFRRSIARLVRTWGSEVLEARSVAEAKQMLSSTPDFVMTDVRLPDGSGREVAVAASHLQPSPVMVAMSGLASASEAFALAQCGVRVYLTKPFAQQELVEAVEDLLARSTSEDGGGQRDGSRVHGVALENGLLHFAKVYNVTEREMELVRLTMAGVPRGRCPALLNLSENTCKTLARRLLQRCGARNLAEIPRLVLLQESEGESI